MTPTDSLGPRSASSPSIDTAQGAGSPVGPSQTADTHADRAGRGTDNLTDHTLDDDQCARVGEAQTPPATRTRPSSIHETSLADPFLDLAAAVVEDLEKVRIANQNRLRILTTPADQEDEDGVRRGFGLDTTNTDVARLSALVDALEAVEHQAVLNLQKIMRANAFAPWAKPRKGVGEKLLARLLAQIGDPYWNTLKDEPRTVSQLWAYCGLHVLPASQMQSETQTHCAGGAQISDPAHPSRDTHLGTVGVAAKRRKGIKANWSTMAKTRAYLIAESVIKCGDPHYTAVYKGRRAHTAETHPDWSKLHSHNDGLRIVSKALLKDLWIEARSLHTHPTR